MPRHQKAGARWKRSLLLIATAGRGGLACMLGQRRSPGSAQDKNLSDTIQFTPRKRKPFGFRATGCASSDDGHAGAFPSCGQSSGRQPGSSEPRNAPSRTVPWQGWRGRGYRYPEKTKASGTGIHEGLQIGQPALRKASADSTQELVQSTLRPARGQSPSSPSHPESQVRHLSDPPAHGRTRHHGAHSRNRAAAAAF